MTKNVDSGCSGERMDDFDVADNSSLNDELDRGDGCEP